MTAFVDREHLVAALARIVEDLVLATDADERDVRRGAIGLLQDALNRYAAPAMGLFISSR